MNSNPAWVARDRRGGAASPAGEIWGAESARTMPMFFGRSGEGTAASAGADRRCQPGRGATSVVDAPPPRQLRRQTGESGTTRFSGARARRITQRPQTAPATSLFTNRASCARLCSPARRARKRAAATAVDEARRGLHPARGARRVAGERRVLRDAGRRARRRGAPPRPGIRPPGVWADGGLHEPPSPSGSSSRRRRRQRQPTVGRRPAARASAVARPRGGRSRGRGRRAVYRLMRRRPVGCQARRSSFSAWGSVFPVMILDPAAPRALARARHDLTGAPLRVRRSGRRRPNRTADCSTPTGWPRAT